MSNTEIDPFVMEVLGGFYKPETIVTKTFHEIGDPKDNLFRADIIFPPYNRMRVPIVHVSGIQMYVALYEVGYLATARAVRNGTINSPVSYQDFIDREDRVIVARVNIKHEKWLQVGEESELLIRISRSRHVWGKSVANFEFDGFISGRMMGLLDL